MLLSLCSLPSCTMLNGKNDKTSAETPTAKQIADELNAAMKNAQSYKSYIATTTATSETKIPSHGITTTTEIVSEVKSVTDDNGNISSRSTQTMSLLGQSITADVYINDHMFYITNGTDSYKIHEDNIRSTPFGSYMPEEQTSFVTNFDASIFEGHPGFSQGADGTRIIELELDENESEKLFGDMLDSIAQQNGASSLKVTKAKLRIELTSTGFIYLYDSYMEMEMTVTSNGVTVNAQLITDSRTFYREINSPILTVDPIPGCESFPVYSESESV